MDNDDRPIGRVLSRREALALMGVLSAAALAACSPVATATQALAAITAASASSTATLVPTVAPTAASGTTAAATTAATTVAATLPSCIVRPALTEGPYFVDEKLNRSDIRTDPSDGSVTAGVARRLNGNISPNNGRARPALRGPTRGVSHRAAAPPYSAVHHHGLKTQCKKVLPGRQT